MTEQEAMEWAVLENPLNDEPRLVYADWLDDHAGQVPCLRCLGGKPRHSEADCEYCDGSGAVSDGRAERAEFIRVQCELARCDVCNSREGPVWDWACGHKLKLKRERELWHGSVKDQFVGIPPVGKVLEPVLSQRFDGTGGPVAAVVRRGFVNEVRLTLATFMGDERPCPNFEDSSSEWDTGALVCCRACDHTGIVGSEGVARDLFARHPVTRVVLTDREPSGLPYHDGDAWAWLRYYDGDEPGELPDIIWHELAGYLDPPGHSQAQKRYRTSAAAANAASDAYVAYGRALAGLPKLEALPRG